MPPRLTHKAQGSQWDSVLVLDESKTFDADAPRHLYTAITRAADRVTVVLEQPAGSGMPYLGGRLVR